MSRVRKAILGAVAVGLAAFMAGCVNPFQPAKPELPVGSPVIENFSSPESLIATMAQAVMKQGESGRIAYYDAIADSTSPTTPAFYAFHYPGVVDLWTNPPAVWDRRLEKLFYDYLIAVYGGYTYTFAWDEDNSVPKGFTDETAGYAELHQHYLLQASSSDGQLTYIVATGNADLYFRKLNSRWFLFRWEDRLSSDGTNLADQDHRSMGWRRLDSTSGGS